MPRRAILLGSVLLMTLATRLLLVSGGAGSFTPPAPTTPPFDDSWSRSGSNPILTADESWDEAAVVEAFVMYDAGWKMWYRGGWSTTAIGYATASDPVAWTKYGSNPIIGQGVEGISGNAQQPYVVKVGSTYYMYLSDAAGNQRIATSANGITGWSSWSTSPTLPGNVTRWGNRTVWNEGGSTWKMLIEGFLTSASVWRIWYATSSDGLAWTLTSAGDGADGEYTSLLVGGIGGATGGPRVASVNGTPTPTFGGLVHIWYHAVDGFGNLPTDVYHATTADLTIDDWTITSPNPVLTHLGSGFEVDQVAGPCPLVVGGTAYLFYDGDDNTGETAAIGVATAPAQ